MIDNRIVKSMALCLGLTLSHGLIGQDRPTSQRTTIHNQLSAASPASTTQMASALGGAPAAFAIAGVVQQPAGPTPASNGPGTQIGKIDFAPGLVPQVQTALPVIRLAAQAPPAKFVKDVLAMRGANLNNIGPLSRAPEFSSLKTPIPDSVMGLMDNGHLLAYWDQQSGDAEIFPLLGSQQLITVSDAAGPAGARKVVAASSALTLKLSLATRSAQQVFARPEILPLDATQYTIGKPRPVLGATATRTGEQAAISESDHALYLTYVPVQRMVSGHPVYGPGSRALVAVGNDGSIQGLLRRWKTGAMDGEVQETRTAEQVRGDILRQLQPLAASANVSVLSVEVAYFDNNINSIQPVYRITAKVHHLPQGAEGVTPAKQITDDDFIVRYLPIGAVPAPQVSKLILPSALNAPRAPLTIPAGDPTVGRYVVRNDDSNWVANANEFWDGISGWPFGSLFTNAQYFWAMPFEFNTSEAAYVNSVNVALSEVHGDWWFFTTYQNWGDGVDITAIPASQGYGAANGGQLAYWALHSCEVVPSWTDAPCSTDSRGWWTPWFNVFQGLHSVVGYRTIMFIDDDATGPFGTSLEWGAPVVSAWFNATNSAPDYAGGVSTPAHCGVSLPMGRPSTVSVCGHENDSIFDVSALPAAGCLHNLYQPN